MAMTGGRESQEKLQMFKVGVDRHPKIEKASSSTPGRRNSGF